MSRRKTAETKLGDEADGSELKQRLHAAEN